MTRFADPIAWETSLAGLRPSSPAWQATIRAAYGSSLSAEERELYLALSGGIEPPEGGSAEVLVVGGRRGGKSETIARVAVFEALHGGHEVALAPGQVGLIAVISPLREQSQEILGYARGLAEHRAIKKRVVKVAGDEILFATGIAIRVMTCDAVALSGPTLVCAIRDEWSKWPGSESATPDTEIENSLRPALAPVAGAPVRRLIGITSAYLREGAAYDTEQAHYAHPDSPVMVLRGNTQAFNPAIDVAWLDRERRRVGERVFAREYLCVWQDAITTGWFGSDIIDKCVDHHRQSSPRVDGLRYSVAIDQAFKGDRFAIAVAHAEHAPSTKKKQENWAEEYQRIRRERARALWSDGLYRPPAQSDEPDAPPTSYIDYARAWRAPKGAAMSVEERAQDVAGIAKRYGTTTVYCDQFAAEPLKYIFARYGITLKERPWTGSSKPLKYRTVRDQMIDERVRLPNNPELIREFHNIQGRLLRSGGEQIEAHRGNDDLVSAAILALSEAQVGVRRGGSSPIIIAHGTGSW